MGDNLAEIISIFNFLKEFDEITNPVITEIDNQKWKLNIFDIPLIDEIRSVFLGHEVREMDYLEIKRPVLISCPKPPEALLEWIENDWKNLNTKEIMIHDKLSRKFLDENGELVNDDELFSEDEMLVEAYINWLAVRDSWREAEIPRAKGLDLYNNLFQLYSEMKRESESVELIIGDGNIRWYTADRVVDHPVLLQKVLLHFDANIPSFRVYCEEEKSEVYTPMLRVIPSINQKMLSDIIKEIDEGHYEISQFENTMALFKRIINVIDTNGTFTEESGKISEIATIHSAPILFLRKRTLGFSGFIESIIDEIQKNSEIDIPEFYEIMSGKYPENPQEKIVEETWNQSGIDEEVLLTLPANNEQLSIIKYLNRYGAVLVQGPPGTGKTHTIANVIGHLLSQGNSVLVTSHTEKALTVLKEKVYRDSQNPELNFQNLCLSLLSSTSQKKEMDEAINEIASKSSSIDLSNSLQKIKRLEEERKEMINNLKQRTNDLVRARSNEYKDLIYDNHSIAPIDAAKFLNSGTEVFDYIDGKSNNDEIVFPLTYEELHFLYDSNNHLTYEEENLLVKAYPPSNQIMSNENFEATVDRIIKLREKLEGNSILKKTELAADMNTVKSLLGTLNRLISIIDSFEPLDRIVVNKTILDPTYPKLWEDVLKNIKMNQAKYESVRKLKLHYDFSIDESIIRKTTHQSLQEMIKSGKEKPVGLFSNRDWKRIKDAIKIDGKAVQSRDEFIKADEIISYEVEEQNNARLIEKLLSDITDFDQSAIVEYLKKIRKDKNEFASLLSWFQKDCQGFLKDIEESIQWDDGKKMPRVSFLENLDAVLSYLNLAKGLLQAIIDENDLNVMQSKIDGYKAFLSGYEDSNPYIEALLTAVNEFDNNAYVDNLKALNDLIGKNELAGKRKHLLAHISEIAPILAKQIKNREGIHSGSTIPEHFDEAWKHFQLRNQIERLDGLDSARIKFEIDQINTDLLKKTRELAFEKAWYEKIKNQTPEKNQALQGWRTTVKQIGKGTGKNAPRLKKEARELMSLCQMEIPVWIMPLNRVVETFDPRNNKFDVIIIDEASQANILSLGALYLAKKVIIVGDDEQVSPDAVGVRTDEVNALIAQHLERIPNNHLFNGLTSLYDIAKSSGFKPLMLTEHFRCLPEIIGFSNDLSYSGRIKPLRDSSSTSIHPAVVEYRVPGASRNSEKVNEVEANHIVSLIQAVLETDAYKGETIGVISMLGNEQSAAIEKKLQSVIDPIVYEERRIQCGTPPQFQGDERDIVFLSLVDSPNENGGPLRKLSEDGNNDKYRKRYNVAVSRARNQLWVVHSLNPEIDLKKDDIRLKLIKYAMNPNRNLDNLLSKSESPFEMEVMKLLKSEHYKIIPQYKVGAYRIDMVIQYGDKKVALECDGERFHTSENLSTDLARQAILERLGWRFIRIRGSEFYRYPEQTIKNVMDYLSKHGIYPSFEDEGACIPVNDTLLNAVKSKANAYRDNTAEPAVDSNKPEIIKSVPKENLKSQSDGVSNKTIKVKPKNLNIRPADLPKTVDIHKTNNGDVEKKVEKDEVKPNFDFSKKQETTSHKKEKLKTVEVETKNNSVPSKPKFDFRNRSS